MLIRLVNDLLGALHFSDSAGIRFSASSNFKPSDGLYIISCGVAALIANTAAACDLPPVLLMFDVAG